MNDHENHTESMKTMKVPWALGKHENQPKIVKKPYHGRRWLDWNNRNSSDGKVCPKTIDIASLSKKDYRHRIATKI